MKIKQNIQRIGIDFDKVFVNYPPFIPDFLIDYLYKKRNHNLSYRFPGKIEQKIRVFSHLPLFRHPVKDNVKSLKKIAESGNSKIYLISSRFSFLADRTRQWDRTYDLFRYFTKSYFNKDDEQPHKFKDRIIKKEKIKKYIDDDLDLLLFLSRGNPDVEFYWLNRMENKNLPNNITRIENLEEFFEKYV